MATQVQGALALRKALRNFEPDLAKETTKQIAGFLKPIVKDARGFLPDNIYVPSGWVGKTSTGFPKYDATIARRGVTYKTTPSKRNRSGFQALASIFNKTAAGAIYETAGRKAGVVGNFSPKLRGELKGSTQKKTGRAIFRAYFQDQGKATGAILKAIEASADKFNARREV
jgi:hypothetical protein